MEWGRGAAVCFVVSSTALCAYEWRIAGWRRDLVGSELRELAAMKAAGW